MRGSTLMELLISLPITLAIVSGTLSLSYYIVAQKWIQHLLHESLLCANDKKLTTPCRQKLIEEVESTLPIGVIEDIDLIIRKSSLFGKISFVITEKLKIQEVQRVRLPLLPGSFSE